MTRLLCTTFLLASIAKAGTIDYQVLTQQCTSYISCSNWMAVSLTSSTDGYSSLTITYTTNISGWKPQPFTGAISMQVKDNEGNVTQIGGVFSGNWTIVVGGTTSYPTYTGTLTGTFTSGGTTGKVTHTIYNHAVKMGRGPMVRQSVDFGGTVELTN